MINLNLLVEASEIWQNLSREEMFELLSQFTTSELLTHLHDRMGRDELISYLKEYIETNEF